MLTVSCYKVYMNNLCAYKVHYCVCHIENRANESIHLIHLKESNKQNRYANIFSSKSKMLTIAVFFYFA